MCTWQSSIFQGMSPVYAHQDCPEHVETGMKGQGRAQEKMPGHETHMKVTVPSKKDQRPEDLTRS
jgi:hypothetical protein